MITIGVSGVRSRTHVVYLTSYLRTRAAVGEMELFDLDDSPLLSGPDPSAEWKAFAESCACSVRGSSALVGGPDVYVAVGRPGIKPILRMAARRRLPGNVVVTDEGIGSYGTSAARLGALVREGKSQPRAFATVVGGMFAGAMVRSERWSTYLPRPGGWDVNQLVRDEFVRERTVSWTPGDGGPWVGCLLQPWPELGVGTEADQLRGLARLRRHCERNGTRLLVIPHPSEPASRYTGQFEVLPPDRPAELEAGLDRLSLLIGETSTSLLHHRALFGLPAMRLDRTVGGLPVPPLHGSQRSLMQHFLGTPVGSERIEREIERLGTT